MPSMKKWWKTIDSSQVSLMFQFQQKLKKVKQQIKKWNREVFGNICFEKENFEKNK
jgi:hypothetical protein